MRQPMAHRPSRGRALKQRILSLLRAESWQTGLDEMSLLAPREIVNPLFGLLLHKEERVRRRAVTAMAVTISRLATIDMERARVIMRRLMWSLNDESGGIGWGAPEVMGETLARSDRLAAEYGSIFISYADEQGNFLEYEVLQRGLLWGLIRLARVRPELVKPVGPNLSGYLHSPDTTVRGLAAWLAGLLGAASVREHLQELCSDPSEIVVHEDDEVVRLRVNDLARRSMQLIDEHGM